MTVQTVDPNSGRELLWVTVVETFCAKMLKLTAAMRFMLQNKDDCSTRAYCAPALFFFSVYSNFFWNIVEYSRPLG